MQKSQETFIDMTVFVSFMNNNDNNNNNNNNNNSYDNNNDNEHNLAPLLLLHLKHNACTKNGIGHQKVT